jgi:Ribosomal RNA adenine dimethylase
LLAAHPASIMNDSKNILEPIGGYLLDLGAKLRNDIFVPHSLTKLHNLARVRSRTGATTVIEVGSYKGVTTFRLSHIFSVVHSIEIDENLFAQAQQRCAGRKNVMLHHGDGKQVLRDLAPNVMRCVIFFDGHFSGGDTGQGDEPEPVLAELDLIGDNLANFVGVVIDDFREFGTAPGWPKKSEVLAKLERVMPEADWLHTVMHDQFVSVRRKIV